LDERRPARGAGKERRAVDAWAYFHHVKLDFIRPAKPVENGFNERFNGMRRDECLNS
jgi:putative transposase